MSEEKKVDKNTSEQREKLYRAIETLDELFGHEDVDDETLQHARALMRSFTYKVTYRMREYGLSTEELANDINIPTSILEDILNGDVFIDWITFYKLKARLNIPVMFYDF